MTLNETIYQCNVDSAVWSRPNYIGISYSDGEEQEKNVLNILTHVQDLSVNSAELRKHCTDWVTNYHFSSLRANLLRPLSSLFHANSQILEIGAGCGAITRFLGETGAQVLALEGSIRRANIARIRTKNLKNVTILSEKFQDFTTDLRFDVITLVGVLEYTNMFSQGQGQDSAIDMLKLIKAKLKPAGKIIIAIENQLGLKYFAGAREDHISQVMYGVEGRYTHNEAETYGYHVLTEKLRSIGMGEIETLLPFPDYKLVNSIITEKGMSDDNFDAAAIAAQSVCADRQPPPAWYMVPELVWPVVVKNKLGLHLANSFLMIAGEAANDSFDKDILAIHFSNQRQAAFCKTTVFRYGPNKTIVVTRHRDNGNDTPQNDMIGFDLNGDENYINGVSLSSKFIKIVTKENWSIAAVAEYFRYYLACIKTIVEKEGAVYSSFTQNTILPPVYLDAIPSNILVDAQGQPHFFEREWFSKVDFTVGHLVFRAMLSLLEGVSSFALPQLNTPNTRGEFVYQLFECLAFSVEKEQLEHYLKIESELNAFSQGDNVKRITTWNPDMLLRGMHDKTTFIEISKFEAAEAEIVSLKQAKKIEENYAAERLEMILKLQRKLDLIYAWWPVKLLRLPIKKVNSSTGLKWSIDYLSQHGDIVLIFGWLFCDGKKISHLSLCLEKNKSQFIPAEYGKLRDDVGDIYSDYALSRYSGFLIYGAFSEENPSSGLQLRCEFDDGSEQYISISEPKVNRLRRLLDLVYVPQLIRCYRLIRHGGRHHILGQCKLLVQKINNFFKEKTHPEKSPSDAIKSLLNELEKLGLTFFLDHNLGGGANIFSREEIERILSNGEAVLILNFNIFNFSYQLSVKSKKREASFEFLQLEEILDLLGKCKIKEIVYNNAVSYVQPQKIPGFLINLQQQTGAELRMFAHDLFPICPSQFLIDEHGNYCNIPDPKICESCLRRNSYGFTTLFKSTDINQWRNEWGSLIGAANQIIFFSNNTLSLYNRVFTQLKKDKSIIVPHTVNHISEQASITQKSRLVIGIVGHISYHKGAKVVQRLAEEIMTQRYPATIVIVGVIEALCPAQIVKQTGNYQRSELPDIMENNGINLVLFPSIVPETFSYVVQEMIELSYPIASFDIGAPAERLREYPKGRILSSMSADNILKELIDFHKKLYS